MVAACPGTRVWDALRIKEPVLLESTFFFRSAKGKGLVKKLFAPVKSSFLHLFLA